ncbi:MAG: KH domain-containing protein [Candidatus Bathyarchaeota archaeon]|nr:KH domain-containing protein [Candidatus Bathyarchaeota archaeon]MDH5622958.1 KH domain-containing protein [Candidatus Bathyarchaeota archaeon]MDH5701278.1 KH domain-containing protein [Candidatus Bathyarchaeota archaeon]
MEGASALVKVPQERIGALVGPDGRVKANIEKKLSVRLQIDSQTGDIQITLMPTTQDPTVLFRAKEIVTAIGRGFSPEHAFRLLEDDEAMLEMIDLRETVGRSQSDMKRLKGRVIGKEGKTRRIIEELTEANICVYGHTISIIGEIDQVEIAKEAVRMLIRGSLHGTVYRFLHRKRRELKKKKMELWETSFRD